MPRGTITAYNADLGAGIILGDDGGIYRFTHESWTFEKRLPAKHDIVTYEERDFVVRNVCLAI